MFGRTSYLSYCVTAFERRRDSSVKCPGLDFNGKFHRKCNPGVKQLSFIKNPKRISIKPHRSY